MVADEDAWLTDGNGTILKYLGTNQQVELDRVYDEIDKIAEEIGLAIETGTTEGKTTEEIAKEIENTNYSIEVAQIFGNNQEIIEQYVEDYIYYLKIAYNITYYCPTLYAMDEGKSYDSQYQPYETAILEYIKEGAARPTGLPEKLEIELNYFDISQNDFEIPEEMEEIDDYKKETITIPSEYNGEKITTVGNGTSQFSRKSATNIIISEGIETINSKAFQGQTLNSITLPTTIKTIGDYAFYQSSIPTINGLENASEKIGDYCFGQSRLSGDIKINAKEIGYYSFSNINNTTISSIEIGNNVETIGENCFSSSNIQVITFEENGSLNEIKRAAFSSSYITSITIPNTVTSVGDSIFSSCSRLTTVYTPILSNNMFGHCTSLSEVNITSDITAVPNNCFVQCEALKNIQLPDSVIFIDSGAFQSSGLTTITMPNSLKNIGNYAFYNCLNLTTVVLNSKLQIIGDQAFEYCNALTEITLPNYLTSIGKYAFEYCTGLTEISIPASVTTVGKYAFSGCTNLTITVTWETRPSGWDLGWKGSGPTLIYSTE